MRYVLSHLERRFKYSDKLSKLKQWHLRKGVVDSAEYFEIRPDGTWKSIRNLNQEVEE